MKKRILKIWNDPVISKVIAGIILSIPLFYKTFRHLIYEKVSFLLNLKVSIIYLLIVLLLLGVLSFIIVKSQKPKKNEIEKPSFWDYNSEILKGYKWSWSYIIRLNAWTLNNLEPHCKICNTSLLNNGYLTNEKDSYFCPRCEKSFEIDNLRITEAIISDNINKRK